MLSEPYLLASHLVDHPVLKQVLLTRQSQPWPHVFGAWRPMAAFMQSGSTSPHSQSHTAPSLYIDLSHSHPGITAGGVYALPFSRIAMFFHPPVEN
jgi:hypothetical protein